MPMPPDMDDIDFLLLHTISESDEPLWKRRLTQVFNEYGDTYRCLAEGISPQTVGRRVDALHEQGLLEECGVRPHPRSGVLAAYNITERGEDALREWEDAILREYAEQFSRHVITEDTFSLPVERRRLLLEMIASKFDVDLHTFLTLRDDLGVEQFYHAVVCSLALYYLKQHVPEHARGNPVLDLLKEESREYVEKLTTHIVPREEEERLAAEWGLD